MPKTADEIFPTLTEEQAENAAHAINALYSGGEDMSKKSKKRSEEVQPEAQPCAQCKGAGVFPNPRPEPPPPPEPFCSGCKRWCATCAKRNEELKKVRWFPTVRCSLCRGFGSPDKMPPPGQLRIEEQEALDKGIEFGDGKPVEEVMNAS